MIANIYIFFWHIVEQFLEDVILARPSQQHLTVSLHILSPSP